MDDLNFDEGAKLLAALANDKRLHILQIISREEIAVGDLADRVGLSQSALSQHLARLRSDAFVTTTRQAQNIYYSTSHPGVCRMLETLDDMRGGHE
ncbi:metalloregulator ArsR/SmtB family transcription factor [Neorhizobium sp. BT27B]|uniref:ArsR/SmtB family transcription factor n=1 Tax=Neorhizobium sp. BT27B TaxID=3142625 RepID=UPI003D2DE6D3